MIISNLKSFPINIILINLLLCLAQICHSFDNDFINQHAIPMKDDILMEDDTSMEEESSQIQNKLNNMKLLESYRNENLEKPSSRGMSSSLEDPSVLKTFQQLQIRPNLVQFSSSKPYSLPDANDPKRRNKRESPLSENNLPHGQIVHDVCPSVSDWVAIDKAKDQYGRPVNVAQRISVNGTVINQYFYETFCAIKEYNETSCQSGHHHNVQECKGIDKKVRSFRFNQ